ncbi:MAG: EMC3/TMCO1 family protein [Candidatus Thorarchaeota archaeon]|jgi:uncharacterized membrane protein (DUF106 family)
MQDVLAGFIEVISYPPFAAIFIMTVSVTTTVVSQFLTKRLTDMRRLQRYQAEIKQYQTLQKEAEKSQNAKLLKKVKRRKAYIDRIQREMMTDRCKPSLLLMIPMLAVFYLLRTFYLDPVTQLDRVVVVLPFNAHVLLPFIDGMIGEPVAAGFGLSFWGFYFLVGMGLSGIIQRFLGTQMSMT